MKYRCIGCSLNCTVSMPKGSTPKFCMIFQDQTADWKLASEVPKDNRMNKLRVAMSNDAKMRPVVAIDRMGGRTRFRSISEAARTLNVNKGSITRALKDSRTRSAGGYFWEYVGRTKEETALFIAAQLGTEKYIDALKEVDPERYQQLVGDVE